MVFSSAGLSGLNDSQVRLILCLEKAKLQQVRLEGYSR
jgi:hypothetical protein